MAEYYEITVAGCKRQLPICAVSDKLDIAAFIMLGDVEMTVACAEALMKRCPDFDCIITAECKGIPLAYEMSKLSKKPYLVARKGKKLYMRDPIVVEVQSITTEGKQKLFLDRNEAEMMSGKRILIVDDVVSTGESLKAIEKLVGVAEGNIVGKAFVLAEGDAKDRDDIVFLEPLPLFFK